MANFTVIGLYFSLELTNRVLDHNFQITQTDKGDFTKPVDHMCA